jgi:processing peptidase subunit alpha
MAMQRIAQLMFRNKSSMPKVPISEIWSTPQFRDPPADMFKGAEVTTLANGIRVASVNNVSPLVNVGVFFDAGSRYETAQLNGISNFLETIAFKSTTNRTDFMLTRDMAAMGGNLMSSSSQELMWYSAELMKEASYFGVQSLADIIQCPEFRFDELADQRALYKQSFANADVDAAGKVMELVMSTAYPHSGLGLPTRGRADNADHFTADNLREYMRTFYTPSRMVVSGVGYDHKQLVEWTEQCFDSLSPDIPDLNAHLAKAEYVGGEFRQHGPTADGLAHVALGFEAPNWLEEKDLFALCVLQIMMGGGGSFSSGGPGKGMYSRLYTNLLNSPDNKAVSASNFTMLFRDSSTFGLVGSSAPHDIGTITTTLSNEAKRMTGPVTPEELARAKKSLVSGLYLELESRQSTMEDMGRQLLTYGHIRTAEELAASVEQVTAEDVQRVAARMLATKPTVSAVGELGELPDYETIVAGLKL